MAKRLWIVVAVVIAAAVVSCRSPAVRKKPEPKPTSATVAKAQPEPKAVSSGVAVEQEPRVAESAKAPGEPKPGAVCPEPPPRPKPTPVKPKPAASKKTPAARAPAQPKPPKPVATVLPRLVDLGATTCVPCKMMTPILEELTKEYSGRLKVEFVDVRKDPSAGEKYGIRVIPTQIFFDERGEEFFRHEGFYPKEDILRKFKDQGIDLGQPKTSRET